MGLASDVLSVDTMMAALREYSFGKGGSENGALGTAISLGAFRCVCVAAGKFPETFVTLVAPVVGCTFHCTYLDMCTK